MCDPPFEQATDWGTAPLADAVPGAVEDWGTSVSVAAPTTEPLVSHEGWSARLVRRLWKVSLGAHISAALLALVQTQLSNILGGAGHFPSGDDVLGESAPADHRAAQPSQVPAERRISAWIDASRPDASPPYRVGAEQTLILKYGSPVAQSLLHGERTLVPEGDVADGGLLTEWVVTSTGVALLSRSPTVQSEEKTANGRSLWVARFSLHLPMQGESETREVTIVPTGENGSAISIAIYRNSEIYRQFEIDVPVASDADHPDTERHVLAVSNDVALTPLEQTGLIPDRAWAVPPGNLSINVKDQWAFCKGQVGNDVIADWESWHAVPAQVAGRIQILRGAAEAFRARWSGYLNALDPGEMKARLSSWTPPVDWSKFESGASREHNAQWDTVAQSAELRDLAHAGRQLFDMFFVAGSPIRGLLDRMPAGQRLDIYCTSKSGYTFLPHIPWGLMYCADLPPVGQAIDPMSFLGLRLRLEYMAHVPKSGSKALGRADAAHTCHCLYWGTDENDEIAVEARRQQAEWGAWTNQVFAPADPSAPGAKQAVLDMLYEPKPTPAALIHLFCRSQVGAGQAVELGFGPTRDDADRIRHSELGTAMLRSRPLIIANACATSGTDPYFSNELETTFFGRDCRGFLGTETRVPIVLASRFASVFFHCFHGRTDKSLMSAGEAVAQSRLFLWSQYKNIGGLLYTYINQYELFMADEDDLRAMQKV